MAVIEIFVTATGLQVSGAAFASVEAAIVPAVYAEPVPPSDDWFILPGMPAPETISPAWVPALAVEAGCPIAMGGHQVSAVPLGGRPVRFAVELGAEISVVAFVAGGEELLLGPWVWHPADCDFDGRASVDDLLAFLGAFRGGRADYDGDGDVTTGDLLAYLAAFRGGLSNAQQTSGVRTPLQMYGGVRPCPIYSASVTIRHVAGAHGTTRYTMPGLIPG